jgi:serine/threonine protein phosphatase PrpC
MDLAQVLEIASCTDPGMVRSHNEDSIATDAAHGLVVLADGMGGYNAGEVASGMATSVIVSEMRQVLESTQPNQIDPRTNQTIAARLLREQVLRANSSIYQAAQNQPQYAGMGTTLVASLFYDNRVLVAHLGDSRLYLLRDGGLRQVTRDHSLLQEQIDSGLLTIRASSPRSTNIRRAPATCICSARMACATWSTTTRSARRCRRSAETSSSPRSNSCRWPTTTAGATTFRLYSSASCGNIRAPAA